MIKLIATDLDGTAFLNGAMSEKNMAAIQKAVNAGVDVVYSTGRGVFTIPEEYRKLPGVKYAITSNGTCIYDLRTNELLRHYTLNGEITRKLVDIGQRVGTEYEIFVGGAAYVNQTYYDNPARYGMPEKLVNYIKTTRTPIPDIFEYINSHSDEIENFAYVVNGPKMHNDIVRIVSEECPDSMVVGSEPQWVEVMNILSGKDKGVMHMAEYLGLEMSNVAAFGDGDNDIEMLECAGVSVAMGNASPGCMKVAKYVTRDVTDDGLAYGIECILNNSWC